MYKIWCEGEEYKGWVFAWPIGAIYKPQFVLNEEHEHFLTDHYNVAQ